MRGSPSSAWSRFVPVKFHARGGLGEVLVAQDTELNRHVALKRILGHAAGDAEARRRFLLEAEITGRLEHPGIVPVYGLGVDPQTGQLSYAMRFISGKSLKSAIDEFHKSAVGFDSLAFRKLLGSFVSVCQTIGFAHSRSVLHRDLKPANVMVGSHGETLVVDWGLAKVLDGSTAAVPTGPSSAATVSRVTRAVSGELRSTGDSSGTATKEGAGTPGYMAPEQAAGEVEQLGPAADVYGLGATLYHLLVGVGPLEHESTLAAVSLTLMGQVPRVRSLNPAVPVALDAVCAKAMAQLPAQRYRRAEDLAADVERWLADEPVSCLREGSVTQAKRWMRRHPTTVATSLAVVVLAGLAAVGATGLVSAQRSALAAKQDEITAERDRAVAAEKTAAADRDRARAAEQTATDERDRANIERDRAVTAEKSARVSEAKAVAAQAETARARDRANSEREEARNLVRECLDIARSHPAFKQPGAQEARELLLRKAVPFHNRWAGETGTRDDRLQALLAKFEAAVQSAQTKSKPEAIALFQRCVAELEGLVRDHPTIVEFSADLARMHNNLGVLQKEVGDRAAALASHQTSLAMWQKLAADYPTVAKYRAELATSLANLGGVQNESGDRTAALASQKASLALREKLVADNPSVAPYRADLAHSHNSLGILQRVSGDRAGALASFQAAVAILEQLVVDAPAVTQYRADLAAGHVHLGLQQKMAGDRAAAMSSYKAALAMFEKLTAENPAVVEFRADLALTYNSLGNLQREAGDRAGGLASYKAALAIQEKLAADNPTIAEFRADLAAAHLNLGLVQKDLGDGPAALASMNAAIELARSVPASSLSQKILFQAQLNRALLLGKKAVE